MAFFQLNLASESLQWGPQIPLPIASTQGKLAKYSLLMVGGAHFYLRQFAGNEKISPSNGVHRSPSIGVRQMKYSKLVIPMGFVWGSANGVLPMKPSELVILLGSVGFSSADVIPKKIGEFVIPFG